MKTENRRQKTEDRGQRTMNKHLRQIQSRRELLGRVLRYATLGLLGVAGGWGFAKRRRLVREGKCVNHGICRGCEVFEKCGLPQALSAKQVLENR